MGAGTGRSRAIGYLALYALLWGAAFAYLFFKQADWSFPLVSLGVFGVALSGVAWALTRRSDPPPVRVRRPKVELAAVLIFMVVYALGFLGVGMQMLKAALPEGQTRELVILAVKLAVHVAIPALILLALGGRVAPLFSSGLHRKGFWPTLIVMGVIFLALLSVVSPSLQQIADLQPGLQVLAWAAPAAFVWIALEAGLAEEFLFRAVLQTRLAAVLRSETGAVILGALVFALAHVPGLYLRGAPGEQGHSTDLFEVIAYTIGALSPVALMLGVIWARTRSLLLVVLLHAAIDVLPILPEFLTTWAGLTPVS
ncbi:CPBP family intramembrane glutamic endopeptidase [Phenylobacterium sp.]|uniref:CPBP family intramembrane glutamic endopeptidase n=1 Tax=Phenylobacterium sp. TaxID=1871053 RepID=UPI0027252648|nr:CPBP family intramembrane glutamic endopeptidase [Phenylobacterium sp.]MDO8800947.1 CPBP family intramembrane metalloprotease [Phenylobacterium sp.]